MGPEYRGTSVGAGAGGWADDWSVAAFSAAFCLSVPDDSPTEGALTQPPAASNTAIRMQLRILLVILQSRSNTTKTPRSTKSFFVRLRDLVPLWLTVTWPVN